MRGSQSIYGDIFEQSATVKRGRTKYMVARDRLLLARYYYYASIKGLRFERCLAVLEDEFFIGGQAIVKRITLHAESLKSMVNDNITAKTLKQQYPHLVWE